MVFLTIVELYVCKCHALTQTIAIRAFHSARTIRVTRNDRSYHSATFWFPIISWTSRGKYLVRFTSIHRRWPNCALCRFITRINRLRSLRMLSVSTWLYRSRRVTSTTGDWEQSVFFWFIRNFLIIIRTFCWEIYWDLYWEQYY